MEIDHGPFHFGDERGLPRNRLVESRRLLKLFLAHFQNLAILNEVNSNSQIDYNRDIYVHEHPSYYVHILGGACESKSQPAVRSYLLHYQRPLLAQRQNPVDVFRDLQLR